MTQVPRTAERAWTASTVEVAAAVPGPDGLAWPGRACTVMVSGLARTSTLCPARTAGRDGVERSVEGDQAVLADPA